MARIITGILERVDTEEQAVLVGTVLLRVSRRELIHGLKEGMRVTVRCEHSGEQVWATAVTPVSSGAVGRVEGGLRESGGVEGATPCGR